MSICPYCNETFEKRLDLHMRFCKSKTSDDTKDIVPDEIPDVVKTENVITLQIPDETPRPDAVLECRLVYSDKEFIFNIGLPGLQGNIMASRQNEKDLCESIVIGLRSQFGTRVDRI